MSELQDMLRVQARLHRKQGANALGDLFENASKEIEQLNEQLAKANESIALLEKHLKTTESCLISCNDDLAKANERITELENNKVPEGYIAVPGDAWHEQCQYEAKLDKANARVKELESGLDLKDVKIIDLQHQVGTLEFNRVTSKDLNKFAIEKKIEALKELLTRKSFKSVHDLIEIVIDSYENQLRKEQE